MRKTVVPIVDRELGKEDGRNWISEEESESSRAQNC